MSTPAAFPFAGGFLLPAHNGSALVTVFASVRARHKHRPTLGAGPRPSSVEQGGTQPLVCWQDGGAEPFTDQGIGDTLDADTRLPTVIKSKAVAGEVVGARHHRVQPHLCGQGVPPVEGREHNVGSVGDVAEHVAHRLARHDLLGAGLGDGHAGGQGLVGHFQADDLAGMLQIGGQLLVADPVIRRGLDLLDRVAAQG